MKAIESFIVLPSPEEKDLCDSLEEIMQRIEAEENKYLNYVRIIAKACDSNVYFVNLPIKNNQQQYANFMPLHGYQKILEVFKKKYNTNTLKIPFTIQDYLGNEILQELLEKLSLDKEEFWYLLLFIYSYSYDLCKEGVSVTIENEADKLLKILEKYWDKKNMSITIKELDISIEGTPQILSNLIDWVQVLKIIDEQSPSSITVGDAIIKRPTTNWAFDFARKLAYFFNVIKGKEGNLMPIYKERQLIVELLSFTDITSNYDVNTIKRLLKRKSTIKTAPRSY